VGGAIPSIVTPRLELVSMSVPFMEALARKDLAAASAEMGAIVPAWVADELENFLKYRLGQLRLDPSIRVWLGRAMVLTEDDGTRRVVGSIGFHGPPDEQGRLEVG
jgi:ribosomal-protein-alanine N-acetyltransferase